jgi:hypothetical protein
VAEFIGYPTGKVLAVFDRAEDADRAVDAVRASSPSGLEVERFAAPMTRTDSTPPDSGTGPVARVLRTVQFGLMDQLPAMAWYEAALREGKTVVAIRTRNRTTTLEVVEALKAAGGHFINHFGRAATEEFARWQGPEPHVSSLMKH